MMSNRNDLKMVWCWSIKRWPKEATMAIFQWPGRGGGVGAPPTQQGGVGAPRTPHLGANASLQFFFFLLMRVDLRDLGILSHSYMHFMMWMDNYWLIFIHRSCRHTSCTRKIERHESRNIRIRRSLWVDNLCNMSLSNFFISIELFLLYILIYKTNVIYGYRYDLWFTGMVMS